MAMKVCYTVINSQVVAEQRGNARSRYVADPIMSMTEDPIGLDGGDNNLSSYVGSNPTSLVDPSGLKPLGDALCRSLHYGDPTWRHCSGSQWNSCLKTCSGIGNVKYCCSNGSQVTCVCLRQAAPSPVAGPVTPRLGGGNPDRPLPPRGSGGRPPVKMGSPPIIPAPFTCAYTCPFAGVHVNIGTALAPIWQCLYSFCTLAGGPPSCPPGTAVLTIDKAYVTPPCGAGLTFA
jgi:hypothetical protein